MPWGFYGRGFWGWGRGFGNPYPFCRRFPWLPRGWWRFGYTPQAWGYGASPYLWGYPYTPYPQPPTYPYPPTW